VTPDKPFNIAVALLGSVLCWVLPARWALVPLALSISMYPGNAMLPPDNMGLTPQRVIAMLLLLRCLTSVEIRRKYTFDWVDKAAILYFLLLLASQLMSQGLTKAINNRAGFFMGTMAPFWCVRMLIRDRESFFALIKGWLWGALVLGIGGMYQHFTGYHPYYEIMRHGIPPITEAFVTRESDMRKMFGVFRYRANCPFLQCIMFGWFFSLLLAWSTALYWEKRKFFPWIIPWAVGLPMGIISSIAGGPMMLAALSFGFMALFPLRQYWRGALIAAAILGVAFSVASNRNVLELMANMGFDAGSSWYRVGLNKFALSTGMAGKWLAGWGEPWPYHHFNDLCIHWVYIAVYNGIMGLVGFYTLLGVCAWQLWKAKKKAHGLADEWILWALLSALVASQWAMLVVALFGEMQVIYHMFMAVVANATLYVGSTTRRVGVMAEVDGKPVMLVYHLKPGQKLAMVTPVGAAPEEEPVAR